MISRNILLSSILIFLAPISIYAKETIHYDITLFGNTIGKMTITREIQKDSSELYILESSSAAKILWINRKNFTRYEVRYKNGKLMSSSFMEKENDEVMRWTNVSWNGKQYKVDSYKGERFFSTSPKLSIVTLFFNGLDQDKVLFYEAEADFNQLKKSDEPDTWEFKSSDGNRNVYHLKNGKVSTTEFHVSIATVKVVRID